MSERNPYGIPPISYTNLSPKEQSRIDLLVEVDNLCKHPDIQKINDLISRIQEMKIGGSKSLIRRLREVL